MRSHLITSVLTIALGLATPIVSAIGFPGVTVAQTVDQRKVEADRLFKQGEDQYKVGKFESAFQSWQRSLGLYREIKDRNSEGKVIRNIGNVFNIFGDYSKAIEFYEKGLQIAREVKNRAGEGSALGNLGIIYGILSNYSKAIEYHERHLAITHEVQDRKGEGIALGNLGVVYGSLSNYPKAIEYHEKHLVIAREIQDREGEGRALGNLGVVYDLLGNYLKAVEYHEQRLYIARQLQDQQGEGAALRNLGNVNVSLGNYLKAMDYYEKSLIINKKIKNKRGEEMAISSIGSIYLFIGNSQKALEYYENSLNISRDIKYREGEQRSLNNLGLLLEKKEPELAIVFYKQAVNIAESIRKDNRPLSRELQASYTETVAGTYRNLADLLLSQGRIGEAQKVLELLKVQELNDITEGSRSPSLQQNQVALSKVEEQIIQKHTSLIQFGQLLSECKRDSCIKLEEYKATHRKLTEAYDKFIEDLKTQLVTDRDKSIAATTDDFTGGASKIVNTQPNTVLIYPLVLKDKTRILWASKGGILSQAECPLGEADLSKLIKQFRDDLQNNSDLNPVQKTGQKLYECLLPKTLRTELTKNKIDNLVFVPDRITNYIPMAALYDGKNYLIETFAVSNILSVGLTDTKDKLPDRPSVLGFGLSNSVTLSNPTRNFSSLPFVPIELAAIVQSPTSKPKNPGIFPGTTWLDRDFSRNNLETKLLSQKPNILHIATHGEFVAASPKTSYLVLGDGTPYPMSEIQYLDDLQNVHLVVLSACETALGGSDSNGLEVAGIASYFLSSNAKAKAVLASLWKVNDPATSILMSQFYASLATDRLPKAQALRKVQRDLITSKLTLQDAANRAGARLYEPDKKRPQNLSHPYYWAPFILIGNSL
jgi:CHAT domain-containing protein